jgi:alkylhydroperoxidase family enzyme
MKLADALQPPCKSLSRQQQFGSQRRAPLSGVNVSRLAPESGRRANQITNALHSASDKSPARSRWKVALRAASEGCA